MSTNKKPAASREFWVHSTPIGRSMNNRHPMYSAADILPQNPGWIHVIEKSAYDELLLAYQSLQSGFELEKLEEERDALAKELEIQDQANEILARNVEELNKENDELYSKSFQANLAVGNANRWREVVEKELAAAKAEAAKYIKLFHKTRDERNAAKVEIEVLDEGAIRKNLLLSEANQRIKELEEINTRTEAQNQRLRVDSKLNALLESRAREQALVEALEEIAEFHTPQHIINSHDADVQINIARKALMEYKGGA